MKHVLIMDDNVLLALEWAGVFEGDGHQVTVTHTGEDAVAHLQDTKFDLVITDLFVPQAMSGFHVIGKLMTLENAPPVIAVTGARRSTDGPEDESYFLKLTGRYKASATLEKPFPAAELLAKAQEIWG